MSSAEQVGGAVAALEADLHGLWADPPRLPPRWFYDERGSLLFDEITRLPEYYPTRCEAEILCTEATGIVGDASTLVELGSGTSEKTRVLLDVLARRSGGASTSPGGALYVPVDISEEMLLASARAVDAEYPGVRVEPVVGDFTALAGSLPGTPGERLVLFLGGTLGNFTEAERARFWRMLRGVMDAGDRMAVGFDLVKDPARLEAAYDDAAGVTAEFDLNVLDVIGRTVAVRGLDRADFRHESVWNADESRIEMWLRAVRDVRLEFPTLGRELTLAAGEGIRTEIARKFTPDELTAELSGHGFAGRAVWTDAAGDFGLLLAEAG